MAGSVSSMRLSRRSLHLATAWVAVTLVSLLAVSSASASEMASADALYWSNSTANVLSSAKLDGTGGGNLTFTGTTVTAPSGTAIDAVAGVIYWVNSGNDTVSWARLNGPGGTLDTTGATVSDPRGLAIDPLVAGRVYWTNATGGAGGTGTISYANLDGAGGGDLLTGSGVSSPNGITVNPSDGTIYWANSSGSGPGPGPGSIMSANVDGSNVVAVPVSGAAVDHPSGLALDPYTGTLYWANAPGGALDSIAFWNLNTDTGGELSTSAPVNSPNGIAIDPVAGRLYWVNAGNNTISSANLDGSNGGVLGTTGATVSGPAYPVLLVAPAGAAEPSISGAATVGSTLTCEGTSWARDLPPAFYYRAPRNISWQWSRDGTDIAGATATSYDTTSAGSYTCRELGKNHAGTTALTSSPFTVSAAPLVSTAGATAIGDTSATLTGSVNPQYAATAYHFDYGTSTAYGSRAPSFDATVSTDGVNHAVAQAISGIQPNRTYHFRLVATNANGTTYGADQTFSTAALPSAVTRAASTSGATSVVLHATVNPANLATRYYFEFGPTRWYGSRVPADDARAGADAVNHRVSVRVSGLTPNRTYHFRVVAINLAGTSYGADRSFTTIPLPKVSARGRIGTVGSSLRLTLRCKGALSQKCRTVVKVRVFERLSADGRTILGVSAARPRYGRIRQVTVAARVIKLSAGTRRAVRVRLNAVGRALRSQFTRLPARVVVKVRYQHRTRTVRTARVTFRPNPPRVRLRTIHVTASQQVLVRLRCLGSATQLCAGTINFKTFERLSGDGRTVTGLTTKRGAHRRLVTLGQARYSMRTGTTAQLTLHLTKTGKRLMRSFARVPAKVKVLLNHRRYKLVTAQKTVTLRTSGLDGT